MTHIRGSRKKNGGSPAAATGSERVRPHGATGDRGGFVLVFVLALIVAVAILVAGFARKSLVLAQTVADAQESLQRRWGARSCQRFLLSNAGTLLDGNLPVTERNRESWPLPAHVDFDVPLGDFHFYGRVSDEDAKTNLNALARRGPDPRTELTEAVQKASSSSGLLTMIRYPTAASPAQNRGSFQTWEQVFDLSGVESVTELVPRLQTATLELTCWGGGQVNIRRASDSTVQAVCRGQVHEECIARLLALRRAGGTDNIDKLLEPLKSKAQEPILRRLLVIDSKCYSLWLTAQGPRRSWTSFTIDRSGKGNPSSFETFSW